MSTIILSYINLCFAQVRFYCLQIVQLKEGTTVVATSEGKRVAFRYYLVALRAIPWFVIYVKRKCVCCFPLVYVICESAFVNLNNCSGKLMQQLEDMHIMA